jgi:hypothetical protein
VSCCVVSCHSCVVSCRADPATSATVFVGPRWQAPIPISLGSNLTTHRGLSNTSETEVTGCITFLGIPRRSLFFPNRHTPNPPNLSLPYLSPPYLPYRFHTLQKCLPY